MKHFFFIITTVFLLFSCRKPIQEFRYEKGEISIASDTDFKILFNENHSKGETWSLVYEFDSSTLEYIKSNYHGPSEGLTDFIFHAKNKGETNVKFNLVAYAEIKKQVVVKIKIY